MWRKRGHDIEATWLDKKGGSLIKCDSTNNIKVIKILINMLTIFLYYHHPIKLQQN